MAKASRLKTYEAKRDFRVTPEPAPGPSKPRVATSQPRFVVHKHDATRLHYDLRLEMDGALASWAIPKGPSYDPAVKRLAVQTEDHPLEYGNFEGRIPDGEYGAGDSIIWDRGTYETIPPGQASQQRKKGHLFIELHGEKLKGRWHLVRTRPLGGKEQWLLFKAKDGTEDPRYDVIAERPESVLSGRRVTRGPVSKKTLRASHPDPEALLKKVWPPMLATLSKPTSVEEGAYVFEVKYDGYRGIAALSGGRLAFQSRNGLDLSSRFPDVARALSRIKVGEAVIDGEVVARDARGVSHFQQLMAAGAEHQYVAFDLLWLEGEDLRPRPLEERRDLLESVLAGVPAPIVLSERLEGSVSEVLAEAKRRGLEGAIAKRRGSPYSPGRSSDWLKLKVSQAQEVAIIGFTPISRGGDEIGALLVAVHDGSGFRYAGKVGTGFSNELRLQLRAMLEQDRIDRSPAADAPRMRDAIWVKPRYVAQVAFTEWTQDGKLRHPSFQGLREDKKPEEAIRELPQEVQGGRAKAAKGSAESTPGRGKKAAPPPSEIEPVALTNPDRLVFPRSKLTKRDVFDYYRKIAPVMVPALQGRPLTLQQWPKGIDGPSFFRQNVSGAPPWATFVDVEHERRKVRHLIVDRPETLLWLANQSALTLHIWSSRVPHLSEPDWVVFDLDPTEGRWEELIQIANALRALLEQLGLESVPKTSGKRGLHVLVPVARGHTYADALDFAVAITRVLEQGLPQIATTERSVSKRGGRIYLDAFQNGQGKTIVAPYSLRALEGAPVSTPLRWREVTPKLDPMQFNLKTVPPRVEEVGDLFAPALAGKQRLPRLK
jgi:bifunctional non-homologous end joining protein LigD